MLFKSGGESGCMQIVDANSNHSQREIAKVQVTTLFAMRTAGVEPNSSKTIRNRYVRPLDSQRNG